MLNNLLNGIDVLKAGKSNRCCAGKKRNQYSSKGRFSSYDGAKVRK
jgi:hypothetical protein